MHTQWFLLKALQKNHAHIAKCSTLETDMSMVILIFFPHRRIATKSLCQSISQLVTHNIQERTKGTIHNIYLSIHICH